MPKDIYEMDTGVFQIIGRSLVRYLHCSGVRWGRACPRTSRHVEPSPPQTPQLSSLAPLASCRSQPTSCTQNHSTHSETVPIWHLHLTKIKYLLSWHFAFSVFSLTELCCLLWIKVCGKCRNVNLQAMWSWPTDPLVRNRKTRKQDKYDWIICCTKRVEPHSNKRKVMKLINQFTNLKKQPVPDTVHHKITVSHTWDVSWLLGPLYVRCISSLSDKSTK